MHRLGYRPEPVLDQHWLFDRVRDRLSVGSGDVDLRDPALQRRDQRWLSSCVAHAVVRSLELTAEDETYYSALAVYYLARELMDPPETRKDEGTHVSTAFDAVRRFGVCRREDWPYETSKFTVAPSWRAMRKAYVNRIPSFYRIVSHGDERLDDILRCLHAGRPVVFGTDIPDDWSTLEPDDVRGALDGPSAGGHAMAVVGYVDQTFVLENSWGADWCDDGYAYVAPEFLTDPWVRDIWCALGD